MTTQIKMEQAIKLNRETWARIKPSKIHGVGVFALAEIKRGQKLYLDMAPTVYTLRYADFSKLRPEVKQILLERFPQIVHGSTFVSPTERFQAFMNHSDGPNYDAFADVALRDILEGEEITEDYRLIPGWEKAFPWLVRDTI